MVEAQAALSATMQTADSSSDLTTDSSLSMQKGAQDAAAISKAYDGSALMFKFLRAGGWGPLVNLGYFTFQNPWTLLDLSSAQVGSVVDGSSPTVWIWVKLMFTKRAMTMRWALSRHSLSKTGTGSAQHLSDTRCCCVERVPHAALDTVPRPTASQVQGS